jgi:hypothetical protein
MGTNYGHSKVVIGTKIMVDAVQTVIMVDRFDPKTGEPVQIPSPGMDINLILDGVVLSLPPDKEYFIDSSRASSGYDHDRMDWLRWHFERRMDEWLVSLGLKPKRDWHEDEPNGKIDWFNPECYQAPEAVVIGKTICSGQGESKRLVDVPFESVTSQDSLQLKSYLEDKMSLAFPGAKVDIGLFLFTTP